MEPKVAFIYGSFNQIPPGELNLQGFASVRGGVLNLSPADDNNEPRYNSIGRVLYVPPIKFWEEGSQAIFETTLTFKIDPRDSITPADGITFFIAPKGIALPVSSKGASLGVFDAQGRGKRIFAVEFDTFVNDFERGLSGPHIGIDIESWDSKAITHMAKEDILGKKVTATITYRERRVTVVAFTETKTDTKTDTKTYSVSYGVDLSKFLDQDVQVGISASTGDGCEVHSLYSWSFASALVPETE